MARTSLSSPRTPRPPTTLHRRSKYAWTMREVSEPAVPPAGADRQAGAEPPAGPVLPPRRVLRDEVLLVLGLSLAASAAYALVDLLSAPLRGVAAPLFANTALIYQLLDLATSMIPVLLVLHFLGRSRESAASIGLDARAGLGYLALRGKVSWLPR